MSSFGDSCRRTCKVTQETPNTMTVRIKYGVEELTKSFTTTPTVGQIISDPNIKAGLGFGDNVKALIGGVEQPDTVGVPDGTTLVIETAANRKAG